MIRILDIAGTRHRREACDNGFGAFDERVVFRDQHEKSGVATRGNNEAAWKRRIINASGGSSEVAQIDTQISVGRAAASDDKARINAVGIGGTELGCLRVLQRKRLEADDREHPQINCDVHWRRRDRLVE